MLQHLKTIKCDDSNAYEPKIWCDDVVEFGDIFEVENEKLITTTQSTEFTEDFETRYEGIDERFGFTSGVLTNIGNENECIGALQVTHLTSKISKLFSSFQIIFIPFFTGIEDVKTNELSRSFYRNIRLPSERQVVLLNNMGNCCWNLYSRKNFRGGVRLHLSVGNSKVPDFTLKSVKKVECK